MGGSTCTSWGRVSREGAAFCDACGARLAPRSQETRKVVTILFCDVTESTALGERLDPEALRRVLRRFFDAARTVVERYGGTVEKYIGDAVMAIFGIPLVHEDDALRAVQAAWELRRGQESLNAELAREHGVTLRTRIGIHTGEVVAGDGTQRQAMVSGDTGNVAARLEQLADPDEILLSAATFELVRDHVSVEPAGTRPLKGRREAVEAYRLGGLVAGSAQPRSAAVPFVGRDRERRLLAESFARVVEDRTCVLYTILGPPGIGKTRVVDEVLAGLGDGAWVLRTRCLPYGQASASWPLLALVRSATDERGVGLADEGSIQVLLTGAPDAHRVALDVAAIVGVASEDPVLSRGEGPWALGRLFEEMASEGPLVLVFDDLQWAQPALLDMLERLGDRVRHAPVLVVAISRPELLDVRPSWGGGQANAVTVTLEPLQAEHARELARHLGGEALSDTTCERIVARAEGNPLFVEELHAMLSEGNAEGIEATEEPPAAPARLQALLAARLDALPAGEREILARASVIGKVWYPPAVEAMGDEVDVGPRLAALERKDLAVRATTDLPGEVAYRFPHLLLREATYAAVPKDRRATLHERFATWLGTKTTGDDALSDLVAYHLERAVAHRRDLGPLGESVSALRTRAARALQRAGQRAQARGDTAAAEGLLAQALEAVGEDDARRGELLVGLARVLIERLEYRRADELLAEAIEAARRADRPDLEGRAACHRAILTDVLRPEMFERESREAVERWLPEFERHGDDLGIVAAVALRAERSSQAMRVDDWGDDLRIVADHARKAGDRVSEVEALTHWIDAAVRGSSSIAEGERRLAELLDRSDPGSPWTQLAVLSFERDRAEVAGEIERCLELGREGERRNRDLGNVEYGQGWAAGNAEILLAADRWEAAATELQRLVDEMLGADDLGHASTYLASLGRVRAYLGDAQGALRLADRAERMGGADDIATRAEVALARSLALVQIGRCDEAKAQARRAVEMLAETQRPSARIESLVDLAWVLGKAGQPDEARSVLAEATRVAEAKGHPGQLRRIEARMLDLPSGGIYQRQHR
ncbi:MAG: adenylate/guanylate cyclase domain-containing protein [Planctomycetaceae bacterium]